MKNDIDDSLRKHGGENEKPDAPEAFADEFKKHYRIGDAPRVIVEGNPGREPPEWFRLAWGAFEKTDEYKRHYGSDENEKHPLEALAETFDEPYPLDAHYADIPIQPTHAAMANGLDACQHHLTKYIWRWKNGKHDGTRDLHAARKLLGQYIHYEETGEWSNHEDLPPELR